MGRSALNVSRPVKVLSILIVDEGEQAKSIRQALEFAGMTAWAVTTTRAAVSSVETFDPDVILVNGDLASLDSKDLLTQVRGAKDSLSLLPAVLFTEKHLEPAGPVDWAATGFDAVLPSPLHLRALPQIIERVAYRRRSVRRKVVSVRVNEKGVLASQSGSVYRAVT